MIDRYDLGASGYGNAYLCDSPNGEVVLYDDHKQIVDDLKSDIISLKSEINALYAEIRDIEYERRNEYDY